MGMAVGAPPDSGQRRTAPSRPSLPPTPPPRSPPPSNHASPAERSGGGRAHARTLADAPSKPCARRGPPVSASSAARTGRRRDSPRASPVPALPQRPAHRRRHALATPHRAFTPAAAQKHFITATPAPFCRRTTTPTPPSTLCPSLESGGATPRRNHNPPSRTASQSIRTPQPPHGQFPPPRASTDYHDAEAELAGVVGGRNRRVHHQPEATSSKK